MLEVVVTLVASILISSFQQETTIAQITTIQVPRPLKKENHHRVVIQVLLAFHPPLISHLKVYRNINQDRQEKST